MNNEHEYRQYSSNNVIEQTYLNNHINQTVDFVKQKKTLHLQFNKGKMTIWEAIKLLNNIIDDSDPDFNLPQYIHAFRTAESLREKYPNEDWLHLVGLIHDLGKILAHPLYGNDPQWAVVGDTFPVGCRYSSLIVYFQYFENNPDYNNPVYNDLYGIYKPNIGLDNVEFSWGHDEYMYQVCLHNNCKIPEIGLSIIRYHSFYSWHNLNAYNYLMNESDKDKLLWVKKFCEHDLYTKDNLIPECEKLKDYYEQLIEKYFPCSLIEW